MVPNICVHSKRKRENLQKKIFFMSAENFMFSIDAHKFLMKKRKPKISLKQSFPILNFLVSVDRMNEYKSRSFFDLSPVIHVLNSDLIKPAFESRIGMS